MIKGGFFHIFVGNTLVKMIAFVSSIVIVRLVDKTDYAYLTYADNLYNYGLMKSRQDHISRKKVSF